MNYFNLYTYLYMLAIYLYMLYTYICTATYMYCLWSWLYNQLNVLLREVQYHLFVCAYAAYDDTRLSDIFASQLTEKTKFGQTNLL